MGSFSALSPWKGPLPEWKGTLGASLVLPVPLDPFAPLNVEEALRYLAELQQMMLDLFGHSHEILLVPYGERKPAFGSFLSRLVSATGGHRQVRWLRGRHRGPGSAVREAVFLSRGRKILVANLECHYAPPFFRKAVRQLGSGKAAVLANRRLADSEFTVPVTLLSLVYRRHLLGVALSRIWSFLFSLPLTDNLSGAYVMKRDFALRVFNRVTCPWFLYEAEMAVVAKANRITLGDLPAVFFLEREKPRLRVYVEIFRVVLWTWRFFLNLRRGEYAFLRMNGNHLTADDWGMSPGVNEGILEMAKLGYLRRVSVMAGGKYLGYRLGELKKIPHIEFGLHFNLTHPESGGIFPSLGSFLWAWAKGRLTGDRDIVNRVRRALEEQVAQLRGKGIRPKRLEGHHHVHAVPGLLGEVSDILRVSGIQNIRVPYHPSLWLSFKAPLAWFGKTIQRVVQSLRFESMPFYYPTRKDFSSFNRLVSCLNRTNRSEVIIHPAFRNDIARESPSDSYREHRVREFDLLRLLALETSPNPKRRVRHAG